MDQARTDRDEDSTHAIYAVQKHDMLHAYGEVVSHVWKLAVLLLFGENVLIFWSWNITFSAVVLFSTQVANICMFFARRKPIRDKDSSWGGESCGKRCKVVSP